MNEPLEEEEKDNANYTFKATNANHFNVNCNSINATKPKQQKGLEIKIITETPDVTGLSVYLNSEPFDYLSLLKESQPEKTAYEFCVKHQLNYEYLQPLTKQIKTILDKRKIANFNADGNAESRKKSNNSLDDLLKAPLSLNKDRKNNAKTNRPLSSNEKKYIQQKTQSELNDSKKTTVLFPSEPYQEHKEIREYKDKGKPTIHPSKSNHIYHKQQLSSNKSKPIQNTKVTNCNLHCSPNDIHSNNQIAVKQLLDLKRTNANTETEVKEKMHQEPKRTKPNCRPLNFGERLFHKNVKLKERTKSKLQSQYNNTETQTEGTKENSHFTFHPVTNPISYTALSKRLMNHKSYNDNRTIVNYRDYSNQCITAFRQKHNYMETCSFAPSIDRNSLRIENTKEINKDKKRYECLYETYKSHQLNKEQLASQIYNKDELFKPRINTDYNCAYTSMSFKDRQGYFVSKSTERLKLNKEQINANVNKETGRPFFHPQINEDFQCTTEYRTTFNELYLNSTQNRNKIKEKEEQSNSAFYTLQNSSHTNKESKELFESMKEKTFKQIFNCLDRNQDGVITKIYIDIKALPKNIAEILKPIFDELKEEENITLNEEEFTGACFHLFEVLSYVQRKELLAFNKKTKQTQNDNGLNPSLFTFKPSINADRTRSKLNKSSHTIISSNKSSDLNSIRQNVLHQHYHILNQQQQTDDSHNTEENKNDNA